MSQVFTPTVADPDRHSDALCVKALSFGGLAPQIFIYTCARWGGEASSRVLVDLHHRESVFNARPLLPRGAPMYSLSRRKLEIPFPVRQLRVADPSSQPIERSGASAARSRQPNTLDAVLPEPFDRRV